MPFIFYPARYAISGYDVLYSALFNGSTGYLSRTFTSSATHSGSMWVKRAKLGTTQYLFGTGIYFNTSNQLVINGLTSNAVFRDPAAWLHIFWNDSEVRVNGTVITGTGTYATSSLSSPSIGGPTNFFDGYMGQFAFGDGQSWVYTDFGELDSFSVWRPKLISGVTYGTEGHLLDFTNAGTLGTDTSGNGNDWTVNGTITQVVDTPGVGDDQNFATLNALNYYSADITLSNGNLTYAGGGTGGNAGCTIAFDVANSSYEWEVTIDSAQFGLIGIMPKGSSTQTTGFPTNSRLYYGFNGQYYNNGSNSIYGASFTTGDVIKVRINNGALEFFKNGVSQGVAESGLTGDFVPLLKHAATCQMTIDFGQSGFTPSAGYSTLQTANLPEPATAASVTPIAGSITGDGTNDIFEYLGYAPDTGVSSTFDGGALTWGTDALPLSNGVLFLAPSSGAHTYSIEVKYPFGGEGVTPAPAQFD